MHFSAWCCWSVYVLSWLCCLAQPQPLSAAEEPRIYRDRIRVQWYGDKGHFWYRVSTGPNEQDYIVVDAESGKREPAFDHDRLAQALTSAGNTPVTARNLALSDLAFETNTLQFRGYGKTWTCDLSSYQLTAGAPVKSRRLAKESSSRRTGEETSVRFNNQTREKVELFWVDSEGRRRSYGVIAAGESRDQHTFSGHQWLVTDRQGKTLLVIEAGDDPQQADIEEHEASQAQQESSTELKPAGPRPEGRRSPDGQWNAWIKDHNLWLRSATNGAERALTTNGTAKHSFVEPIYWAPDSTRLVAMRRQAGYERQVHVIESSPSDQVQPKLHSFEYLKPGDDIPIRKFHLFEASSGAELAISNDLFPQPWSLDELRWLGDSSAFLFVYNQRGHQVLRVNLVDGRTGEVRALVEEKSDTFIDYSGKQFLEYNENAGAPEILWASERDGWNHLYLYDVRRGELKRQVTRGPWVVRGVDRVDWDKRQVWFRASGVIPEQDPYYVHWGLAKLDTGEVVWLTAGDGTHTVQFSPDRRFLVDTWSRVDQAPLIELRRSSDGGQVTVLERADTRELNGDWRAPEQFVSKGRDGKTDIYGVIHWPKGWDPARKYPVIESIYAGPQGSFVPKGFAVRHGARLLADQSYIVVQIDGMGTSDRGKAFHDVAFKNLGDSGFPDRILWLRAAAAEYPSMDLTRVGIYGTSAGGQSALRGLLAHGDFYKAGVADCGCHDNRVDKIWWNEQWMGWPLGPHYVEQSNVTQAHRLQGKLLLMVGELDRNVDPASTLQVVNALIKADKDFELLFMPGEGHGVLGTKYAQRRMVDFFQRALGGPQD